MIVAALIYGVAAALLFRRLTDRAALNAAWNRVLAHTMELGLFVESPALVFRAQRDLAMANLRLLRWALAHCAILGIVFAAAYPWMDAGFGRAPLPVGQAVVVTARDSGGRMEVEAPGIEVETPAVRIPRLHQVAWRVRPVAAGPKQWTVRADGRVVDEPLAVPYPKITWLPWFAAISCVAAAVSWKR